MFSSSKGVANIVPLGLWVSLGAYRCLLQKSTRGKKERSRPSCSSFLFAHRVPPAPIPPAVGGCIRLFAWQTRNGKPAPCQCLVGTKQLMLSCIHSGAARLGLGRIDKFRPARHDDGEVNLSAECPFSRPKSTSGDTCSIPPLSLLSVPNQDAYIPCHSAALQCKLARLCCVGQEMRLRRWVRDHRSYWYTGGSRAAVQWRLGNAPSSSQSIEPRQAECSLTRILPFIVTLYISKPACKKPKVGVLYLTDVFGIQLLENKL